MYPTLIVIVCAIDQSLYDKSEDGHRLDVDSVCAPSPPGDRRGTLSELLATTSAGSNQEVLRVGSSELGSMTGTPKGYPDPRSGPVLLTISMSSSLREECGHDDTISSPSIDTS